jgi:hypothetical protein
MQFDCFSPSQESLELKILHITPEQSVALKNGITGFTPNLFAIPEGFSETERMELVRTSEQSLVYCADNLLPVLIKFLTLKSRLDNKFCLNDGLLFTDGPEIEINIKPIFNELYVIVNYILKTLSNHFIFILPQFGLH